LEGVGVECVRALSGKEALNRLLRQSFALILLDVSMPEMDGFETARLIREHPRFERTPIIFITGVHVTELDSLKGYEVGAIDYIGVPIVPEILRSKVALLVELYRRRAELEMLNRDLEVTRARLEAERSKTLAASQTELRESEQRYRAIFEHPLALTVVLEAIHDEAGHIVDWKYIDANANAVRLLNHSRESLLNMRLSQGEPDRAEFLLPLCSQVLADRSPQRYEMQFAEADYLMCLFPMGDNTIVRSGVDITSRIRAERETRRLSDANRAEKEWLSAVLDSMNEEVYFADMQQRYTYANPAALREFGNGSAAGMEIGELLQNLVVLRPDGTPRPVEESPPLRSLKGEVIRGEEQIVSTPRTQELRHRQVSSAPVRNGAGVIIGSVAVVRDVTDQRRTDAALRLRDARSTALLRLGDRFRALTEPGDLAFAAAEILGETLGVSRCGYGTIDMKAETITIERDWHAPGSSSIAGVLQFRDYGTYIEDLKRGEAVICMDAERDARTASTAEALKMIQVRSFINIPVTEHGAVVALLYLNHASVRAWSDEEIAFMRDVAERTRIAVERRRGEQALATDLKVTRLLRDLSARLVAEGNVQILYEDILSAAMSITSADGGTLQLLAESTRQLQFAAISGLDRELTAQFESIPLVSRSGRSLGVLTTHWRKRRQITDRELGFVDLLARQAADLIERTIAEEELRRSERDLREADLRKDEFIAMLAHELRNPLVPIRTGIELLKSSREQPALIDTVRPMMERQIGHMVRMIDDLLDVSRIASGKIHLRRESVCLSNLVGTAIEANREAIGAGNLILTVNLPEPRFVLNVDPTRFSQVISNLVQNAAKFTPECGRIAVDATIVRGESPGSAELVLKVTDTGEGIPDDMLPRIFDLFAQVNPSGHSRHSGLGIGLALARRLMDLHGGTIDARSGGANLGSEFTIRLPVPPDLQLQDGAPANSARLLEGVRVLVVDDNVDAADVIGMLVEEMGGTVRVAYDGVSGLAALREFSADVVLLDIGMPGMDGYETCRRIRDRLDLGVGIVAITGWGQEENKRFAIDAGFDAHLTKPAESMLLAETINSVKRRAS
ncbi:MAG: hypothetical protein JWN43_836, partial [Gammaproteobacteria bacterium]|nr:hypothetical protein [Gammaproteobacteria bacterium]